MFDDTQFALQFSAIAKEVIVNTEPIRYNKPVDNPFDIDKAIADYDWYKIQLSYYIRL